MDEELPDSSIYSSILTAGNFQSFSCPILDKAHELVAHFGQFP